MGATVFFRVQNVEVAGNVRYTAQQVIDVSGVVQGDNLFGLNKFDTARRLRRQLPYVEAVNIRRSLPDTLVITVTECRAAARVSAADGEWLISRTGKVLERAGDEGQNVVRVTGLDAVQPEAGLDLMVREEQQSRCTGLLALLQALETCGLTDQADSVDLSSGAYMTMTLGERFTVKLPVSGDFDYLLGAMNKAIDTLEPYERGTLDLTVEDYTVVFSPS